MAANERDLRIGLLGPLEVEVDGAPVVVPEGHQRRLLAALGLAAGRTVPVDRLVDLLWGDRPPATAHNSMQSQLTRLRRHLGAPTTITRDALGYRLGVGDDDVDVRRFERDVGRASATDDPVDRRRFLDDALALWRAERPVALDEPGLEEDARRLLARRHAALLVRASLALADADHAGAEADARLVLASEPLHEPATALLVRVLAADGRLAEADTAVQRFRDRLADELGLDPSPVLEQVHTALLRGQLTPAPGSTGSVADAPAPDAATHPEPTGWHDPRARGGGRGPRPPRPTRPPLPRSSFRGRQTTLDELAGLVAAARCVTVLGTGGVGKTRLALEFVHHEPRAVVWADLVSARTVTDVLSRVATAAGCGTPTDLRTLAPLAEPLAECQLLVLDNCEQAATEVAAVVDAVLRLTDVTVLATSRTPLAVDGECELRLAPLSTVAPDRGTSAALALFADRVGRAVDLADPLERRAAEEVAVALDGLPLALELAARHVRNLGVAAVRDRLDRRLELLVTARPAGHPAHSDLRSLVQWSTEPLAEPDQRAFRWLSVFGDAFTLAQAEQLLDGGGAAAVPAPAASVGRLVEQSLLVRHPPDRFRMLETLRAHGADELAGTGEATAATDRHTELVLTAATSAADGLSTARGVAAFQALGSMVADLLVVTDRLSVDGDVERLCRMACGVREYAYETQRPELLRAGRVALDLLDGGAGTAVPRELRDGAVVTAALAAAARGELRDAERLVTRVTEADAAPSVAAVAWNLLGDIRLWGVDRDAEDAYREAEQHARGAGDDVLGAISLVGIVLARAYRGEVAAARRTADELERRADGLRSPLVSAWAAYARGEAGADHDPNAGLAAFDTAVRLGSTLGAHLVVAVASSSAAAVRTRHGDPALVLPQIRDTLQGLLRQGNATVQQSILRNVAVLLTRIGSDEAAASLLGATASASLYEAERRRIALATDALQERLGGTATAQHLAAGAAMTDAELVELALAAVEALLQR